MTGAEAVELGWANRCFAVDELGAATEAFAERIANIEPDMVQMSKRGINRAYEVMGIRTALAVGADIQALSTYRGSAGNFGVIAREKGLKAALNWRDGPFQDYGAAKTRPSAPKQQ